MITRENYEIYFIEFLEGTLSEEEKTSVENFLENNLDLKEELTYFEKPSPLENATAPTVDFSFLKKTSWLNETNEDDFFIGHLEGDLTKEEEKAIVTYLAQKPEKKEKLERYRQTFLSPVIVPFPNKKGLKKKKRNPVLAIFTPIAAAASVLFFVWINFQNTNETKSISALEFDYEIPYTPLKELPIEKEENPTEDFYLQRKSDPKLASRVTSSPTDRVKPISAIKMDKIDLEKRIEIELEKNLKAFSPIKVEPTRVQNSTATKTYTLIEFVKENTKVYASEKTGQEINTSNDLLAFASNKAKEKFVPDFIEVETQEVNKQKYRTIKIGKSFSIKRKIKS